MSLVFLRDCVSSKKLHEDKNLFKSLFVGTDSSRVSLFIYLFLDITLITLCVKNVLKEIFLRLCQ